MSTVPSELAGEQPPPPRPDRSEPSSLQPRAKAFLYAIGTLAAVAAAMPFAHLSRETDGWLTFIVLSTCAAVAQLFVVRTPRDQSYHTTIVFLIPGVLLLPPELIALLGVVYGIPEWLKVRYAWYIQAFNIANHTLNGLAAWGAVELVRSAGLGPNLEFALSGLVAAVVFVSLNHVLLATMLHLARGHSFRGTGLFSAESLSTDFVLALLGVAVAGLWDWNPLLLPMAVAPLLLVHRSLSIPALQHEARLDPKTGLFNARHFSVALREELDRAQRSETPLSVIMADLDLLREINNAYGHLAGDAVLHGIAVVFQRHLRHSDTPARFGGEEFAIVLPETDAPEAFAIAERIRRAVAAESFQVETSSEPIQRHGLVRSRELPGGRDGCERARPPSRPRRVPREAPGSKPRPACQLGARAATARAHRSPRRGTRRAGLSERLSGRRSAPDLPETSGEVRGAQPKRPHTHAGPRFVSLSRALACLVVVVSVGGIMLGALGLAAGPGTDILGLLAVIALVAAGQALALELDGGSISVSAVGALAGAAIAGPKAALPLALATAAVDWSSRRTPIYQLLFNVGALSFASLAAAAVFDLGGSDGFEKLVTAVAGLVAGGVYFVVNTGLLSGAMALEGHDSWRHVWTSASPGSYRTTSPSEPWPGRLRSHTRRSGSTASPSSCCPSSSCGRRWPRT